MVAILRVKARWAGFSGAPGFTVLHFRDFATGEGGGTDPDSAQAVAAATRVRSFFDAIKANLPAAATVTIEPEVEMLEDTTGELMDTFPAGTQAVVTGTNSAAFAGPIGAVINWKTGSVRNGRRIRGRSFIVPMALGMFTTGGIVTPAAQTTLQTAANALVDNTSTPDLGVYARPSAPLATDGRWVLATSATVPTLAAVLRSRRD